MIVEGKKTVTEEELFDILMTSVRIYIEFFVAKEKRFHKVRIENSIATFDDEELEFETREELAYYLFQILKTQDIRVALITPTVQQQTYEYYADKNAKSNWFNKIIE